ATGISSITPCGEWLARRAVLSKSGQRRKSSSTAAASPSMKGCSPTRCSSCASAGTSMKRVVIGNLRASHCGASPLRDGRAGAQVGQCGRPACQPEAGGLTGMRRRLNISPTGSGDMINLDDTDRQLIALLRDNARATVASLAQRLRVARGTVQNRIARLEREGVIAGYTVRLKPQAEAQRIRALMTIAVEGNRTQQVLRSLRGLPQVGTLYSTNGRWDIVAELQAETLEAFDHAL